MSDTPWYKEFFGEDYLRIYAPVFERTPWEVEGIVNTLALPPGSSILDLCCGHGRHAIPNVGLNKNSLPEINLGV